MNTEEIIKMARESGGHFVELPNGDAWVFGDEHIERFFHMVCASEREACAELIPPQYYELRDKIRARGQAHD